MITTPIEPNSIEKVLICIAGRGNVSEWNDSVKFVHRGTGVFLKRNPVIAQSLGPEGTEKKRH
jgi:hypothetical protein